MIANNIEWIYEHMLKAPPSNVLNTQYFVSQQKQWSIPNTKYWLLPKLGISWIIITSYNNYNHKDLNRSRSAWHFDVAVKIETRGWLKRER